MPNLKIAYSPKVEQYFSTNRELVEIAKQTLQMLRLSY